MDEAPLLRHGAHIKPVYQTADGEPGGAGRSTAQERPDGNRVGIVKRYKKDQRASDQTSALGAIKNIYPDAIEYTGSRMQLRGLMLLIASISSIAIGWAALYALSSGSALDADGNRIPIFYIFDVGYWGFLLFSVYFLLWGIRTDLFQLRDEPIMFDRRHRKVYYLFRQTHRGLSGLLRAWPVYAAEYEWDLIDAEYCVEHIKAGEGSRHDHSLVFVVRRTAFDPTIIDSFNIAHSTALNAQNVSMVWEHARRFMEEAGPHLPEGENLCDSETPLTLWTSMGTTGPFGPKYLDFWRNDPFPTAFAHLLFPITFPFMFGWAFCKWLSYKTSFEVQWPREVLAAVGAR